MPTPSAPRPSRVPPWLVLALGVVLIGVAWWLTHRSSDPDPTPSQPSSSRSVSTPHVVSPTPGATQPTVGPLSQDEQTPASGLPTIAASELPRQAQRMVDLIHAGGPFRYDKDGATFGNRERLLPSRPQGYYREYTVDKPGSADRGPWRIIAGRDGDLYWTSDHYDSFQQIVEES